MAVLLPATGDGTADVTVPTDNVGGEEYPVTKLDIGGAAASVPVVAGQQTMAASVPVVLASNHTDVKVTLDSEAVVLGAGSAAIGKLAANSGVDIGDVDVTSSALPTNAAQETGGNLAAIASSVAAIDTGTPAALGQAAMAASMPVVIASNQSSVPVTEASASAIATAVQLIDDAIKTDDAAFTAGTDEVMMAGAMAVAHGANPDDADAGDAVALLTNRHRIPFVLGGHPNVKTAVYIATGSTTDDNILPAINSGTKYAVTALTVVLDQACTVGVTVRIGFGTANVPALGAANADAVDDILFYHPGMIPGSYLQRGDGSGILGVGGDGAELRITCGAATGGTLGVMVTYYTLPS